MNLLKSIFSGTGKNDQTATISTAAQTPHFTSTFGINGFGRIGRTSFRVWWEKHRNSLDLKLINTSGSMDLAEWVHLLKYDSNYGVLKDEITFFEKQKRDQVTDDNPVLGEIVIGDRKITVTAQRDPAKLPWKEFNVKVVVESTGIFTSQEKAEAHLTGGAEFVIISAPPKGGNISTSVIGVNKFAPDSKILSNASCTTNCVSPVIQIMHQTFGIEKAFLTTIHSYTDDQNLHDNSHKDMRRSRSAALNIVPTSTGAAISTTEIIPDLKNKFDGLAIRVPTPVGSLSDVVMLTKENTTIEAINQAFIEAAKEEKWQGILAVTDEEIVSSDIVGRPESSIIDLKLTNVIDGNLVKVVSWYDNEWGYCNRLIEQISKVG